MDNSVSQAPFTVPSDVEYWLALSRLPGVGRATFLKLLERFQTPKAAWDHSDTEWNNSEVSRVKLTTHEIRKPALDWAEKQVAQLRESAWRIILFGTTQFPQALCNLRYPPPYLFIRGAIPEGPAIAVVGSRQATEYGIRITQQIAEDLAAAGVTIVSGFARGIDTAAHKAALNVNGQTVAVWGTGPDIVFPRENEGLVDDVAGHGAVITEFPFGTAADAANFPVRNRLIAGLSDGVLVMQARRRSGALLTAQHALEQGKDVFAIPGEIGQESYVGTHELIKEGARMVTGAEDILDALHMASAPRRAQRPKEPEARALPLPPLTEIERRIYEALGTSACHIDRLAVSLRLSVGETARVLTLLELKGLVTKQAGNHIARAR